MTVTATCTQCHAEYPLSKREMGYITTECPTCGDTRYTSESDEDRPQPDSERMRASIEDVRGVGDTVLDRIERRYDYYGLESASIEELIQVPGVGEETAKGIVETTS